VSFRLRYVSKLLTESYSTRLIRLMEGHDTLNDGQAHERQSMGLESSGTADIQTSGLLPSNAFIHNTVYIDLKY
jgi:hypothetical protein